MTPSTTSDRAPMKQLSSMMVCNACTGSSTPPMPTPPERCTVLPICALFLGNALCGHDAACPRFGSLPLLRRGTDFGSGELPGEALWSIRRRDSPGPNPASLTRLGQGGSACRSSLVTYLLNPSQLANRWVWQNRLVLGGALIGMTSASRVLNGRLLCAVSALSCESKLTNIRAARDVSMRNCPLRARAIPAGFPPGSRRNGRIDRAIHSWRP
jgi:hypothetical protein